MFRSLLFPLLGFSPIYFYYTHLFLFFNLLNDNNPNSGPKNRIENAYFQPTIFTTIGMNLIEIIDIKNPIASCIVTAVPIYFLSPTSVARPEYWGLSATAAIPQIKAIMIMAVLLMPKENPIINEQNHLLKASKC